MNLFASNAKIIMHDFLIVFKLHNFFYKYQLRICILVYESIN